MARGLDGTFFEIHHHNTAEGKYWNPALDSLPPKTGAKRCAR